MTEQEVTDILGAPMVVRSSGAGTTWIWSQGDALGRSRSFSVVLNEGKVVQTPPIPASFQ